jgi:anti-anti-sigma regulatory factor
MPQNTTTLNCEAADGILVVSIAARQLTTIDAVARFERELRLAGSAHHETRWLLNFGDATFFITPAVKTILALMRRLRAHGGDLVLTGLSRDVRYILGLMRLDAVLPMAASVEAGLDDLRAGQRSVSDAAGVG